LAESSQIDTYLMLNDYMKGMFEGRDSVMYFCGSKGSGKTYTMVGPLDNHKLRAGSDGVEANFERFGIATLVMKDLYAEAE
jgi:hypothetical protein